VRQALGVDTQQREIRARVHSHHFCVVLTSIAEAHGHRVGVFHHVVIGDDIAIVRDEKAAAHGHALPPPGLRRRDLEIAAQEFRNLFLVDLRTPAHARGLFDQDLYHRRGSIDHDIAEIRELLRLDGAAEGQRNGKNQ
jgi:hypothetical protein